MGLRGAAGKFRIRELLLCHTHIMDANDILAHATLSDSLNAACLRIAFAILSGSSTLGVRIPGTLSGYDEEYIPGEVLNLAVDAGWIPKPEEPGDFHGIDLGQFYVKPEFKESFIGLLATSLSHIRALAVKEDASFSFDIERAREGMASALLTYGMEEELKVRGKDSHCLTITPEWAEVYKKSNVAETSSEERRALEARFLATHKHPVYGDKFEKQELHYMANVHRKQWDKWRRGEIANNSGPGRRILALLERSEPTRKHLPERNREGFRAR